jgi:hypothetical protein
LVYSSNYAKIIKASVYTIGNRQSTPQPLNSAKNRQTRGSGRIPPPYIARICSKRGLWNRFSPIERSIIDMNAKGLRTDLPETDNDTSVSSCFFALSWKLCYASKSGPAVKEKRHSISFSASGLVGCRSGTRRVGSVRLYKWCQKRAPCTVPALKAQYRRSDNSQRFSLTGRLVIWYKNSRYSLTGFRRARRRVSFRRNGDEVRRATLNRSPRAGIGSFPTL